VSDDALRALERRAAQGDVEARRAFLIEGLRAGRISPNRVLLLALVGDPAALALGLEPIPDPTFFMAWSTGIERGGGHEAGVRAAIAAARVALDAQRASSTVRAPGEGAVAAAERWVVAPGPATLEACLSAGRLADAASVLFRGAPARSLAHALSTCHDVTSAIRTPHLAFFAIRSAALAANEERVRQAIAAELLPWLWGERDPIRDRIEARPPAS
jgi:hypothetical protein